MNLTFTRTRFSVSGATDSGLGLFVISDSTKRGDNAVILQVELPGVERHIRVEPPDTATEYGNEAQAAAMVAATVILARWASRHLGVDLTVNLIDKT